jgi:hypothetical protein
MNCTVCKSANQVEFPCEIAIHFPGHENLTRPHVFAFPRILVCMDCGSSGFAVADPELRLLQEGDHRGLDLPPTQRSTPATLSVADYGSRSGFAPPSARTRH